ncbi:cation channel family protein (macronuclear) [Tetrahymena thermophila SB210]|uniref:Cation channel family protein n=1 Tax=Tetrahymena thermophila (strain SB210) TaxID=312017 RepID=I7MFA9_TETTS|nr:cation channel family protein [Tetrahymena thermophila SB210]EAR99567.2 cation channel family protein [Tetrahymena thermophila SB210]|eukprot:XP_001019812.2 cation channel family protein [Tetrahymena thermophila SB210]
MKNRSQSSFSENQSASIGTKFVENQANKQNDQQNEDDQVSQNNEQTDKKGYQQQLIQIIKNQPKICFYKKKSDCCQNIQTKTIRSMEIKYIQQKYVHISFGIKLLDLASINTIYAFFSLNVFDLVIQLNTDILVKGQEIRVRDLILKEYLKKSAIEDVLPLVMFSIYYSLNFNIDFRYILLPFLVKMRKFNSLVKHFEESSTLNVRQYNIAQLVKLVFIMLFVSHFATCIWIYEAKSIFTDNNWMVFFNINQYHWQEQYIRGYYFIIVTMSTIGYGDLYPINAFEIIMAIFTIIFATGIFGYSINQIGFIFNQIQEMEKKINNDIQIINRYMERKKVSHQLQYKIREYLDSFWREELLIKTDNESMIVNMLNNSLKNELFKETYFVAFQNSILNEYFSSEVLTQSIKHIKEIQCIPEQIIFSKGDSFDHSIYFVESGNIDLYIPDNSQISVLQSLKAGECFGTYSFFTAEDRTCCARSKGFSNILKINREDFIEVLKSHSQDYEMFCHIKDKLYFQKEFGLIYDYCFKCEGNRHLIYQCPKLHYCPDKKQLIFKDQQAEQKRDNKYQRTQTKQQGFFRQKMQIEEGFLQLIDEKEDLIEEFEDLYLYGNMYEVVKDDLDSHYQKQSSNNNNNNNSNININNNSNINQQNKNGQQISQHKRNSQLSQNSQLSIHDRPGNQSQFNRRGSRESTRRMLGRRVTTKEDISDLNQYFKGRKKSTQISSTVIVQPQHQQPFISQLQQQWINQLQKKNTSLTSMNEIEEEKPQRQYFNGQQQENHYLNKTESIKDNTKLSNQQTQSEHSIKSHKNINNNNNISKQLTQQSTMIQSNQFIINNLNNIITMLQSMCINPPTATNNSSYQINIKNNNLEQQSTLNSHALNQNQEEKQQQLKLDNYSRGQTSNTRNNTHYSKSNKQFNFNMDLDSMKIMKQYMIESNYTTVIESLNRVFLNEIRKTRKASFKSRIKTNMTQHRIDIFLKNQELRKSNSQKNIINVQVVYKKSSFDCYDYENKNPDFAKSMSLDFIQDDRMSRVSRLSQSKQDINKSRASHTLFVNNNNINNNSNSLSLNQSQINLFERNNNDQRKNWDMNESQERAILDISHFTPNKPSF